MIATKRRRPRRQWRCVFGKAGQANAYLETDEDGRWWAFIAGLAVGAFINEEAARLFITKAMAMSDDDVT